eukprot:366251-Chlamydomonas_euryale.AAC.3
MVQRRHQGWQHRQLANYANKHPAVLTAAALGMLLQCCGCTALQWLHRVGACICFLAGGGDVGKPMLVSRWRLFAGCIPQTERGAACKGRKGAEG